MAIKWNPFGQKKQGKAIINQAINDRNAALDDIYNMQNNRQSVVQKKKVKR
jgi:hypothetical protein